MPFFPVINIRVTIATLSPSLTVDFCFSTIYSNSRGGSVVLGLGGDGVGGDGVEGGHILGWWVGVALVSMSQPSTSQPGRLRHSCCPSALSSYSVHNQVPSVSVPVCSTGHGLCFSTGYANSPGATQC